VLRSKLKYAIHVCKTIDTDEYARVNMTGGGSTSGAGDTGRGGGLPDLSSDEDELGVTSEGSDMPIMLDYPSPNGSHHT